MPRKPRFTTPGIPQHVIQRGNNRTACFFSVDDYHRYLHDLGEALIKNQCHLHAYVLMMNHIHLLITPHIPFGISHTMQDLGRKYVRYVNYVYQRTGTLWEGRYKSSLVDSEAYLLTCMRYIELNPVRAGMVEHPGEYLWSSYACNAQGEPNRLIRPHPLYDALGETAADREYRYREYFRQSMDEPQLHEIRAAVNQELVLGREDFKDQVEKMSARQVRRGVDGRPRIEEGVGIYYVY